MTPKAHYKDVLSGELLPEDEVATVRVFEICTEGHSHFDKTLVGTVYIDEDKLATTIVNVELLVLYGELVSVYKEEKTYGRAYPADSDRVDTETWERVANSALDKE
jgi:hypothetical protein